MSDASFSSSPSSASSFMGSGSNSVWVSRGRSLTVVSALLLLHATVQSMQCQPEQHYYALFLSALLPLPSPR